MKIAVLTKAIPSYESSIRVDNSGSWIDESVVNYVVNESDSYALEEALQIKEQAGDDSEVVVVTLGSEANTSKVIKDGLAKIILRNSVKDLVPNKLNMNPRKVGFNIPIDSYVNFDEENEDSIVNKKKPIFEIVNFKRGKCKS